MKVKCLSLLRTGNKRICGLLIHGVKQNSEEEILRLKYVCYPLQNRRQSGCFVMSWLLLALLSSHLHAIWFLGWVIFFCFFKPH